MNDPPLTEAEITRERLALEEAIRKVEADAARRARAESAANRAEKAAGAPPERRAESVAPPKSGPPDPDAPSAGGGEAKRPGDPGADEAGPRPPPRRNQFGDHPSLRDQGLKGFRDVVAEAETLGEATAQASKSAREAFAAAAPTRDAPRIEPHVEPEGLRPPPRRPAPRPPPSLREPAGPRGREGQPPRNGEPPLLREAARGEPASPGARPGQTERPPPWLPGGRRPPPEPGPMPGRREPEPGPPGAEPEDLDFAPRGPGRSPFTDADEDEAERPFPLRDDERQSRESLAERLRSVASLVLNRTALIAAAGVVLFLVVSGLAYWQWPTIAGLFSSSTVAPAPVERDAAPSSRTKMTDRIGAPSRPDARPQDAPTVAQRVVLYEEDPANPAGKRHVGTAIWRVESIPSGPGQAVDVAVRAEIEIPEVRVGVKFSVRRNTDKALPASHTIEIVFTLPPDFPNGGISNIPGILMKQAEQTRGVPLAGLAVKVTTGFFLIGLSSSEADVQRNIALLKERAWFDVPVIYGNGRRAIMAIEKGTPGDRAFAEAFAAWGE
jgi:hypothetical protein